MLVFGDGCYSDDAFPGSHTALARLLLETKQPVRKSDRRLGKRYRPRAALCQVLTLAPMCGDSFIVDLSAFGACVSVPGNVRVGSVLHLRLSNREQLLGHQVVLHVTHAWGTPGGPCVVGGTFEELLSPSVVQALMG
jgi:hypothetical protein